MAIHRMLPLVVVAALVGGVAAAAHAQDAPTSRGSVKVEARFFNPFDPAASRISLNPFGVFSLAQPTGLTFPAATTSAAAASSLTRPDPVVTGGELGVTTSAPRPPFRPPVRSPFRPPPRPPF